MGKLDGKAVVVTGTSRGIGAEIARLFAAEPLEKVTGGVTYSQQILKEFGWLEDARGIGVDPQMKGSGYSQI